MYMDWGAYSDNLNYGLIVFAQFQSIAGALTRRLQHLEGEGVSTDNMFLVGHSLGARLVLIAGENMGGRLPFIDGNERYLLKKIFVFTNKICIQLSIQPVPVFSSMPSSLTLKKLLRTFSAYTHLSTSAQLSTIAIKIG